MSPKPSEFWMERSRSFCKDCRSCRTTAFQAAVPSLLQNERPIHASYPHVTRIPRRQRCAECKVIVFKEDIQPVHLHCALHKTPTTLCAQIFMPKPHIASRSTSTARLSASLAATEQQQHNDRLQQQLSAANIFKPAQHGVSLGSLAAANG
jgi:hypothetical protein